MARISSREKTVKITIHMQIIRFNSNFNCKPIPANRELKRSIRMLTNWRLNSDTVVCGFDFMHTGSQNSIKLAMDYRTVVKRRVPFAAEIIGNITRQMYDLKVFESFENIQLIGFSLGCHVSGFVGRRIKSELGKDIPRIIGECLFFFNIDIFFIALKYLFLIFFFRPKSFGSTTHISP